MGWMAPLRHLMPKMLVGRKPTNGLERSQACNSSSKVLASFKSSVSKPSVNEP